MADYAIHDKTLIGTSSIIRKKEGSSALIDPADYPKRINLMGMLEEKTASSASVCSFSDGADGVPLKNWLVTLPASLDGYTEVNGVKSGKNISSLSEYPNNPWDFWGTNFTDMVSFLNTLKSGTYTISFDFEVETVPDGGDIQYGLPYIRALVGGSYVNLTSYSISAASSVSVGDIFHVSASFTLTDDRVGNVSNCYLYCDRKDTHSGLTGRGRYNLINVQIEVGSTATSYEAYTAPTTATASLGRTIYGGTVDIITGEGEDENGNAFTFTPIQADTELGTNNFWADEGDSDVTYRSSGTVTPVPVVPTLITKSITENGTYDAEDDDADGYSSVTVSVSGGTGFVPQFTETLIADNSSHASSFTLSEDYGNYDMVKIVWWESATVSGFLYTTPDILDEIFTVGGGKLCINKPSTNYYICYTASGLTWTQTNQRNIYVHEIYGVTFTNCTMTATDLYKRGASTTTKYAITSQTSLKDYDLFMMSSIHATDGSETMPTTWLYQYPPENMSDAFSCPVPAVLQEYNANDEAFVISEYGMTAARFFMVQGIKFTET